jgi:hypothetical protein
VVETGHRTVRENQELRGTNDFDIMALTLSPLPLIQADTVDPWVAVALSVPGLMTAWTSQEHTKNRTLPLPLEPVLHSPTLAVSGAAVHGAVLSSVAAFRCGSTTCRGRRSDGMGESQMR